MAKCEFCNKEVAFGIKVSHSHNAISFGDNFKSIFICSLSVFNVFYLNLF